MYSYLTSRIKCGLGALLCILSFYPLDVTAKQEILQTLPENAHNLIIYRHLTRIISFSQIELITELKKEISSKEELKKLNNYLKASNQALDIINDTAKSRLKKTTKFPNFSSEKVLGVSLTDPRRQAHWIKLEKSRMMTVICTAYPAKLTQNEPHNFFVFYLHNIQNFCETNFLWHPGKALAENPFIKIFFENGSAVPLTHIFSRGHRYLESPVNKPFLRGGYRKGVEEKIARIYLAFYFQYSELALDVRHISFANREFFVRRNDLRGVIKGFSLVQKLFAALIARGLVG
jgi:hypothetical protein